MGGPDNGWRKFFVCSAEGVLCIFISGNAQFLPFTQRVCVKSEHPELKIRLASDPHPVLLQR
jgi:hypothetical protein